jgi:hypothetical protein
MLDEYNISQCNLSYFESISVFLSLLLKGSTVVVMRATDIDSGPNKEISYSLDPTSGPNPNFAIYPTTGEIYTLTTFDFEGGQSKYSMVVRARDNGTPQLMTDIVVNISLIDENEFAPEFEQSVYTVNIVETQLTAVFIEQIFASDPEKSDSQLINYSIIGGNTSVFSISSIINASGTKVAQIATKMPLDYESRKVFTLTVAATDSGVPTKTGQAMVLVLVQDINDNGPIFTQPLYSTSIQENTTIGAVTSTVNATDLDSGAFGAVTYSIIAGNTTIFRLSSSLPGSILLNAAVDYEHTTGYNLTIQAQDGGTPPRSSTTEVTITILDINDNSPIFKTSAYAVNISEVSQR